MWATRTITGAERSCPTGIVAPLHPGPTIKRQCLQNLAAYLSNTVSKLHGMMLATHKANVNREWLLICAGHNLLKMFRFGGGQFGTVRNSNETNGIVARRRFRLVPGNLYSR